MKKPLQIAGWAGIFWFICMNFVISHDIYFFDNAPYLEIFFIVFSFMLTLFHILFLQGFIVLGKKYHATLLSTIAWIAIIAHILLFVGSASLSLVGSNYSNI